MQTVTGEVEAVNKKGTGVLIKKLWYNAALKHKDVFEGVEKGDAVVLEFEVNGEWRNVSSCSKPEAQDLVEERIDELPGEVVAVIKPDRSKWRGERIGMCMNISASLYRHHEVGTECKNLDETAKAIVEGAIALLERMDKEGLP